MNRLGLTHPSTLTGKWHAETRALYEAMSKRSRQHHFTSKLPATGALVGPFGIQLHTPHLGWAYLEFVTALHQLPGLSARPKEIAILVVATCERAHFMLYAHQRSAFARGLLQVEINSLISGSRPPSFTIEDNAAYSVALELCEYAGPLSDEVWTDAVIALGKEGTLAVVQHVGFYRYMATILRGFNAQVPAEGERVENQHKYG